MSFTRYIGEMQLEPNVILQYMQRARSQCARVTHSRRVQLGGVDIGGSVKKLAATPEASPGSLAGRIKVSAFFLRCASISTSVLL